MDGGCLFPEEVMSMGTWNNLKKGFATGECFSGTFFDVHVWHVYFSIANVHQ
nr:hypothetical protein [Apilactobacillus timberlakei]